MGIIEKIQQEQFRELPTFRSGDTLKVSVRIKEGEKERIQVFQGVVIKVVVPALENHSPCVRFLTASASSVSFRFTARMLKR